MRLRGLLRNRLLHFLAFGAVLWFFARDRGPGRVVDVDPAALDAVHRAEAARSGKAALDAESSRTVDARLIEDELLYREALRMGLDDDDPIVRERLVQKLLLLIEDLGGAGREPTDDELRAYFEEHADRWKKPVRVRFVHVFASSVDRLPDAATFHADQRVPPALGDAFPSSRSVDATVDEVELGYGADFVRAVEHLRAGDEVGPVRSRLGWHRVRVLEHEDARPATFEEAKPSLRLEWTVDRREAVVGAWLKKTASQYDIRVGGRRLDHFEPTRRIAARTEGSAED
jgi:hypothetical protein